MTCLTCVQVFRSLNQRRCLKYRTSLIRPYSVRRSTTHWLRELCTSSRSTFRSPRKMESRTLKHCSASLTSGRCSSFEERRYAPTSGVRVGPVTISQLTMLGLWKHMDSIPHPSVFSLITRPTSTWGTLALSGCAFKHVKLYPR